MSRRAPDHGSALPRALPTALPTVVLSACLGLTLTAGAVSACSPGSTVAGPAPSPDASSAGSVSGSGSGGGSGTDSGGDSGSGNGSGLVAGADGATGPSPSLVEAGAGVGSTVVLGGAGGGDAPPSSVAAADGVGARIVGTDSDVTSIPPAAVDPALAATLTDFGRLYLAFDYRRDAAQHAEALRAYVTPALFTQLSAPIPAALQASLAAEQRVVEPTFVDLQPLDGGLFRLRYRVHTTIASGGQTVPAGPDETRTLTVTVDAAQLVSDVR